MRKIVKVLNFTLVLTIILNFVSIFNYTVQAGTYGEWMDQASGFINKGSTQASGVSTQMDEITGSFSEIGKFLTTIGAGVLVAVTTYMGIKYITAGPEAQAKLKEQLIGVVVSAIVIFGAYGIWKLVGSILVTLEQ